MSAIRRARNRIRRSSFAPLRLYPFRLFSASGREGKAFPLAGAKIPAPPYSSGDTPQRPGLRRRTRLSLRSSLRISFCETSRGPDLSPNPSLCSGRRKPACSLIKPTCVSSLADPSSLRCGYTIHRSACNPPRGWTLGLIRLGESATGQRGKTKRPADRYHEQRRLGSFGLRLAPFGYVSNVALRLPAPRRRFGSRASLSAWPSPMRLSA